MIKSIPAEFGKLKSLWYLGAAFNDIQELPEEFGNCASLKELSLSGNKLTLLPDLFGKLSMLSHLILSGNKIHKFPVFLAIYLNFEIVCVLDANLAKPTEHIGSPNLKIVNLHLIIRFIQVKSK